MKKKLNVKLALKKETLSSYNLNSIKGGTGTTLHHTEKSQCPMATCTCSDPANCGPGFTQEGGSWCVCE